MLDYPLTADPRAAFTTTITAFYLKNGDHVQCSNLGITKYNQCIFNPAPTAIFSKILTPSLPSAVPTPTASAPTDLIL